MVFNGGGSPTSKLSLGVLNFVLAVSAGWALKHYSSDQYALAAYNLIFGHSVLCLLRYTHPNPGRVQRRICEQSLRYTPVIFLTLIVGHLQSLIPVASRSGSGVRDDTQLSAEIKWRCIVLGLYTGILTVNCARVCLRERSRLAPILAQVVRINLSLCVLWNAYCLWQIAAIEEYWWSLGLAVLVVLHHFVLWRLTLRFNITTLEVDTVGMCFSVIFAINASQELTGSS